MTWTIPRRPCRGAWRRGTSLAAAVMLAGLVAPARARGVGPAARPAPPHAPDDSGTFRLYKLQAPVGVETYRTRAAGDSLVLEARWAVSYLGGRADQTATLAWDAAGRPVRLVASGATSTMTRVDVQVARGDAARPAAGATGAAPWPEAAFPAVPYGAYAVEEALFHHWVRLGRPDSVPLVPEGAARFERRGADTARVAGRPAVLDRYVVRGLGWGAQVAWFDAAGRLVAAAQGDAELDRMEAVRAGYEAMLPLVVARSVQEGVAEQAAVGRRVPVLRSGAYALTNARLVDGTGAPPVAGATIVVRGGRIAAAGPAARVRVPPGVPAVDLGGRTVLPGLWDMHVHYEQAEWPLASLAAGVTTARDVGNEFELAVALRDALARGTLVGPRLLLAGVIDGRPGALGQSLGVVTAGTAAEARAAVRRYARAGFRQIKVYQSVPPAFVPVIAAEAHRLGLTVTGHVPTGMDARQFVEAGADQINHWNSLLSVLRAPGAGGRPGRLDVDAEAARAAIAFFAARGTVVDPSFARAEQHAHPRDSGYAAYEPGAAKAPRELRGALESTGAPAAAAARGAASRRAALAAGGALFRGGVSLVLGTDLAVPGHSIHRELELAVAAGLTPMQAVQAATLAPARAMRLDGESGAVTRGRRADLVVLDADPLADISNVRRVRWVVRGGRMYESAALWRAAGFVP
jgi:imidazolonepropionase-like amidohydrolase